MAAYRPSVRVDEIFAETFAAARRSRAALLVFVPGMTVISAVLSYTLSETQALAAELAISYIAGYVLLSRVLVAEGMAVAEDRVAALVAYLASSIVVGVLAGLGLFFLVIPGLMLTARWSLVGPLIVSRGLGVGGALAESWRLTGPAMWPIVRAIAIVCVVCIIAIAPLFVYAAIVDEAFLDGDIAMQGISFASYVVSGLGLIGTAAMFSLLIDRDEQMAEVFA